MKFPGKSFYCDGLLENPIYYYVYRRLGSVLIIEGNVRDSDYKSALSITCVDTSIVFKGASLYSIPISIVQYAITEFVLPSNRDPMEFVYRRYYTACPAINTDSTHTKVSFVDSEYIALCAFNFR